MFWRLQYFAVAILSFAFSHLWYTRPKWFSEKSGVYIDGTKYQMYAVAGTALIGIYCLYKGIKHDPKDNTGMICPSCEATYIYRDIKPDFTCRACGMELVPLKGYFERKKDADETEENQNQ